MTHAQQIAEIHRLLTNVALFRTIIATHTTDDSPDKETILAAADALTEKARRHLAELEHPGTAPTTFAPAPKVLQ